MSKINLGMAREYLFSAAEFLKDKQYTTAKKLSRYLGITTNRAARVLFVLGWKHWSESRWSGTYVRG